MPQPTTSSPAEWLQRLSELSNELLGATSAEGYFTGLNPAWERQLGWTREELTTKPFRSFIHPDDLDATEAAITQLLSPGASELSNFRNRFRSRDGTYRWYEWSAVAEDGCLHFFGQDVTDRLTAEADRDRAAAFTHAIADSVVDGLLVANAKGQLVFVNPAASRLLGYQGPDELMGRPVHKTLLHSVPDGTDRPAEDCPFLTARTTGQPLYVDDDVFWRNDGTALTVSYSAAPIPLLDDIGTVVTFRDASAAQAEREQLLAQGHHVVWFERIRDALEENRFVLYGQPIMGLASGEVIKHELLLRMISPTGEVIAPGVFLPAAEKYGLINDIDRWVISEGIRMAAGKSVAINLSPESMNRPEILLHIERELTRTGTPPKNVTFEVTETALMEDVDGGRRFADHLVALGCSFSLDDFGTGYGTLTYLRQLPISHIKIDVQFVRDLSRNQTDQKLVEGIVHLAKSLDKTTVAEGVEDEETLDLLRSYGVDCAQGYHIGRPEPFDEPATEKDKARGHQSTRQTAAGNPARAQRASDATHAAAPIALTRDELARERDVAADSRDFAAGMRDEQTEQQEGALLAAEDLALSSLLAASQQARGLAAADRTSAKQDRQKATTELKLAKSQPSVIDPAGDERVRLRNSNAKVRDVIADARDRAATRDDEAILEASRSNVSTSQARTAASQGARASSRSDRRGSATDRQEAATDRQHAAKSQPLAEDDRH